MYDLKGQRHAVFWFCDTLMCRILNRVWLRNYIGLHSLVATPRKSLTPQLIGLGHCHTQFRTGNPTFHETHTLPCCFHTSQRRKKALGYILLLLVVGHTFFFALEQSTKFNSSSAENDSPISPNQLHSRNEVTTDTEMATQTNRESWKAPNFLPKKTSQ